MQEKSKTARISCELTTGSVVSFWNLEKVKNARNTRSVVQLQSDERFIDKKNRTKY